MRVIINSCLLAFPLSLQLRQSAEKFKYLALRYDFVAQSFLDGDADTRTILETYTIYALVFEHAIQTLISSRYAWNYRYSIVYASLKSINSDSPFSSIDPTLLPLLTDDYLPPSRLICSDIMNRAINQQVGTKLGFVNTFQALRYNLLFIDQQGRSCPIQSHNLVYAFESVATILQWAKDDHNSGS